MASDLPCGSYLALYIVSMHIINTNSRTSTHWKLNSDAGKVQSATALVADGENTRDPMNDDHLMSLLTNKIPLDNGQWKLEESLTCVGTSCQKNNTESRNNTAESLDCGKPVNETQYDHLRGIAARQTHPHIPEPEVAEIFRKRGRHQVAELDMNELERALRKDKKERPKSAQVYNKIGNFWRIKGNTQTSIECFRKALFLQPNNPDVLLNLARVLFNLQYLDNAIVLTRRSLEMQSADQNSWLQHFTLGEILKAYGHYHEAALHLRHSLDLNPGYSRAIAHLREMEVNPDVTVTHYTLFIIVFLVLGV
ncbi:hypothetical protein CAPTEDRAFT_64341, partial [Capitella teleta]